ncbi:MAG: hypothetical protein M3217_00645 [Actinomycetota bacterium]|nr:hypothetical protein [Actinomycetota bacterium]
MLTANVIATFFSWKLALLGDLVAVAAAWPLWRRTPERSWALRAAIACVAGSCVVAAGAVWPTWRDHARHDGRLARMAAALCSTDLPDDATIVGSCDGSITNTGMGNSCRYLVTATVEAASIGSLIDHLRSDGFSANSFDLWGDPMHDGRTYWRHGDHLRIALMNSWQENGHDLRCT